MNESKDKVVVIGMHRSGTSLISGALVAAGLDAGDSADLLPPQFDNPRGYWERLDVVAENDAMLALEGGSWFDPRCATSTTEEHFQMRIAEIFDNLPNAGCLLKDPRFIPNWRAWEPSFDSAAIVYVYRSPAAVAVSLERRNGMPLEYGLALWEVYNRLALNILTNRWFVGVSYEAFAENPSFELERITAELSKVGISFNNTELAKAKYFDPSLDHSKSVPASITAFLTPSQVDLHAKCLDAIHSGRVPEMDLGIPDILNARIANFAGAFERSVAGLADLQAQNQTVDELRSKNSDYENQLEDLQSQIMKLQAELSSVRSDKVELEAHITIGDNRLQDLQSQITNLQEKLSGVRSDKVELEAHITNGDNRLQDLQSQITNLQEELSGVRSDKVELEAHITDGDNRRQDLQSQITNLQEELSGVRSDNVELEALITDTKMQNEALDQQIAEADEQIEKLSDQLAHERAATFEAEAKAEYLFQLLHKHFNSLLLFSHSVLGRVVLTLIKFYKIVRWRLHTDSEYEQQLDAASAFFRQYKIVREEPRLSRPRQIYRILRYVVSHPSSSFKNLSWFRVKRTLAMLLSTDKIALSQWVNTRFPQDPPATEAVGVPLLGAELDELSIQFEEVEEPVVSVIVPVFNEYRMTVYCLQALLEHTEGISYEVIIADDASTDLTATIGNRISGLVISRHQDNQGFLKNCNTAASKARGHYLVFLNNDTAVTDGWLTLLLETMESDPTVGVVGPKLLYGDGRLQEAGGIIWNDASGWNFGRLDKPNKPEYNYLRECDYISGACLMVRHGIWEKLGGFDERFVPAYYEDVDLCFAVRKLGFEVIYQPGSVVYHFEGISHGTDIGSGIKKHQAVNQEVFCAKWSTELAQNHYKNGSQVFHARDRTGSKRTILIIDHYVPFYDKDAGSRATWLYICLFREMGYNVKFIGANFFEHQPYTKMLQQKGVEVLVGEEFARNCEKWLLTNAEFIDVVYTLRPHVTEQFIDVLASMNPKPKIVYWGCDLHYLRKSREFAITKENAVAKEVKYWHELEFQLFHQVDVIYYPSQYEIDEILREEPDLPAKALPLYIFDEVSPQDYHPEERDGILFVGGFGHPPNLDGIVWFIEEVLPVARELGCTQTLHIVGSNLPDAVKKLACSNIVVHGFLSDQELTSLYKQVRLAVVPLRFGAGVKGKVVEALQQGLPVVTTSIGAEGLPEPDSVMHIADSVESFAEMVVEVVRYDSDTVAKLKRYPAYIRDTFSKKVASQILAEDFGPSSKNAG